MSALSAAPLVRLSANVKLSIVVLSFRFSPHLCGSIPFCFSWRPWRLVGSILIFVLSPCSMWLNAVMDKRIAVGSRDAVRGAIQALRV